MFSPLPLTKSVIYATKVSKDHQQFCWRKSKLIWNVRADVGKATPFPTSVYHPASIANTRPISHMWPMRSFLVAQTYPSSPPALPTLRNSLLCYFRFSPGDSKMAQQVDQKVLPYPAPPPPADLVAQNPQLVVT